MAFDDNIRDIETYVENKEKEIREGQEKITELNKICERLTSHVYAFIGSFDTSNLTAEQKLDLNDLKKVVNSCIKENSIYKDYLEHKYILKDLWKDPNSSIIENLCKITNDSFFHEFSSTDVKEDDTDTFEVKD